MTVRIVRALSAVFAVSIFSNTIPAHADTAIEAYYRGEVLYNSSGGIETGATYLDDAGLIFDTDLQDLFDIADAKLFVYLLWNNNNTFSDQYVMNPGADKSLDNALVFGIRFEMPASSQ